MMGYSEMRELLVDYMRDGLGSWEGCKGVAVG